MVFSLVQQGKKLRVRDLPDPVQLTAPVGRKDDLTHKCVSQPDARSQLKALIGGQTACKETLQCRFWDTVALRWSTEGCATRIYNGTDGDGMSAATGCECSHLSEFVSVTVPTDAFGAVMFGSIDGTEIASWHVETVGA